MERNSKKVKVVLNLPNANDQNVHLGFLTEGSGIMHLHNQILLSYKQFLYEHRKIKQSIITTEFWKYLKMVYKIELETAKKNDKLTRHNRKWQNSMAPVSPSFSVGFESQCKLANQWGKHGYISMLLDLGLGLKVSSLFFIINFCCNFFLFCIYFVVYDCTFVISVMFCKNVKEKREK